MTTDYSRLPAPLFPLGRVVATPGALAVFNETGTDAFALLARHQCGDWGEVPPEDRLENDRSVHQGFRLLSSYSVGGSLRIWIITEADRSVTTLLLPEEY